MVILFAVLALVFLIFFRMQDRSVEKVSILLANPKGETTPSFTFRICLPAGNSQGLVLPALFRARMPEPLYTDIAHTIRNMY